MATPRMNIFRLYMLLLFLCMKLSAEGETQFIYNGFNHANLHLDGSAEIYHNGLLQLTNNSKQEKGHAFYRSPVKFNSPTSKLSQSLSFSTSFVFAIVPDAPNLGGHGIAFAITPSMNFSQALVGQYLGLLNSSNNGLDTNHIFAVELDTSMSPEFNDINNNHVGVDVNSLKSNVSAPATYYSNKERVNKSLDLKSGKPIQVWIDYDDVSYLLNVTLAPAGRPKPTLSLLSTHINLSEILLDYMNVGFSSATGAVLAGSHYILGWSFNKSGQAQSLELSKLPSLPRKRNERAKQGRIITVSFITVSVTFIITIAAIVYLLRKKKFEEIHENWEREYGPQRFSYKDLYKATKGFKDRELLGSGGFGKVYRGVLPYSQEQVAIKKVSHDSKQGMKEFVAEIASMGRLRHRNLVRLLGYCRRKSELLLIYEYMPNGSLDNFLFGNEKPTLDWAQRYQILRGVASALVYLHEEWEQVVLHRDVKASNVLLDANLNGRLGDFGLARLYDHGANLKTTHVVGTIGYLAPELSRSGQATTKTDVFAFGAFMLEVACGRRPTEPCRLSEEIILIDWVLNNWEKGTIIESSDPKLGGNYKEEEMQLILKLGLICSHPNAGQRPSMRQVMQYLDGDALLPEKLLHTAGIRANSLDNESFAKFDMSSHSMASNPTISSCDSIHHGGR